MNYQYAFRAASVLLVIAGCQHIETAHAPSPAAGAHATYLKQNANGYDWFAHASDGYAGVPLILLRSFPDLAPDIWGKPDEQFSRFGLFPDPDAPDAPLPLGLSWDSMDPAHAADTRQLLHPVSLTCGACHIGRVRLDNGNYLTTVGGPNTQFDVRKWRKAFELTMHRLLDSPQGVADTAARLRKIVADKPPNYFFRNFRGNTDAEEIRERQVFLSTANGNDVAATVLKGFADKIRLGEIAIEKQKATSYRKRNAPPLDGGSPGQSDGSGDLIPRLLMIDTIGAIGPDRYAREFKDMTLPALPNELATVTDILSTWQQASRNFAQIDGSVKSPFFRNVAASLAVAGAPKYVNVLNAELTAKFISRLPPPAFPFAIDTPRATRGQQVFKAHCAACHKPFNDNVYPVDLIGTDPNRSRVLNADGLALFLKHFVASVPAEFETTDSKGGKYRPHALPANEIVFDRSKAADQGYVTNALDGLWASAPYLHNGAVPTVYHLLVPAERPTKFVRGSVNYDPGKLGFVWDITKLDAYRRIDPTTAVFDTSWDSASNAGHDRNLTIDANGKILRRDWSGAQGVGEIRVRLDWSGEQNREALADLIEYLKTL